MAAKPPAAFRYSLGRLFGFASPAFSVGALGLPIVIFLPPLYAEVGLNLSLVGTIFMVARLWDTATDPILGVLGDQLNTRWGRRRPVLVLSIPVLMVAAYEIFTPPPEVSGLYLISYMLLLYVGWTMFTLSHTAWAGELSGDYHERSRIMSVVQGVSIFGAFAIVCVPAFFDATNPAASLSDKVGAMGWFILLPLPFLVALALSSVKEVRLPQVKTLSWRPAVSAVARNKPLRRVLLSDLLSGLQGGLNGSLHIFFVVQVLKMPTAASLYIMLLFISSFLFLPIWLRLSYRFGKHRTFCYGAAFTAFSSSLCFFIPEEGFVIGVIVYLLIGVNQGGSSVLLRSTMADVIDEDRVETGRDRGALFYSMLTMTGKLGLALAVGITYPILSFIGFDAQGGNAQDTLDGVRLVMAATPALVNLLVVAIMWNFPLTQARQEELRSKLSGVT